MKAAQKVILRPETQTFVTVKTDQQELIVDKPNR